MKKHYSILNVSLSLFILFSNKINAQLTTTTFSYTGTMITWTVPSCVYTMSFDVYGAQGGSTGGLGGRVQGVFSVTPGTLMYISVGGQGGPQASSAAGGFNGGGNAGQCTTQYPGAGGGGGSDIRVGGNTLGNRMIVAGGGGGSHQINSTTNAGVGGGLTGGSVTPTGNTCIGSWATGGTQTSGGNSCTTSGSCCTFATQPNPSSLGQGGNGGGPAVSCNGGDGGAGGGGGYYGGGGGGVYASGAGGSGFTGTAVTTSTHTSGTRSGNGQIILSYLANGNGVSATASPTSICVGSTASLVANGMISYTWNPGNIISNSIAVNPTSTTSYTVFGTNSVNCVSSSVLTVTVSPGQPTLSIVTSTPQTCLGKTATLTASGAITYTWSNNVTNGVSFNPSVTTVYTVSGQNGCGITTATTSIAVSPISVQVSNTPTITCAGLGVSLTAVAAATNYTWLPGTNLNNSLAVVAPTATTIYTVTVSDGTCSGVSNITLSPNPVPTIVATTAASQVCVGDPIVLNASGGLSYIWNPGNLAGASVTVTPLAPTLYSVVGLNSFSCSGTANQVILTNAAPVLNLSASTQFICPGDPVTLTVNGNAISYTWTNNNSNLLSITDNPMVSTTYTVVGESIVPCYTTQTINVDVFNPPIIISGNTFVCEGTPVTLTGSGADTYLWNNTFPNPYTFTANASSTQSLSTTTSSNGLSCSKNLTVQVQVNPNPTVTAGATKLSMCVKENNVITASGASTYSWSSGQSTSSFAINPQVTGISFYTVTGVGTNGCSAKKSFQVQANACAGLSENNFENGKIKVFPNPSSGTFNIQSQYAMDLNLSNELGQNIREIKLNEANNFKAEIKNLASGIYFISNDQKGINLKVLVKEN